MQSFSSAAVTDLPFFRCNGCPVHARRCKSSWLFTVASGHLWLPSLPSWLPSEIPADLPPRKRESDQGCRRCPKTGTTSAGLRLSDEADDCGPGKGRLLQECLTRRADIAWLVGEPVGRIAGIDRGP